MGTWAGQFSWCSMGSIGHSWPKLRLHPKSRLQLSRLSTPFSFRAAGGKARLLHRLVRNSCNSCNLLLARLLAPQADRVSFSFAGGETRLVPGAYIEFAERRVLPQFAHLKVRASMLGTQLTSCVLQLLRGAARCCVTGPSYESAAAVLKSALQGHDLSPFPHFLNLLLLSFPAGSPRRWRNGTGDMGLRPRLPTRCGSQAPAAACLSRQLLAAAVGTRFATHALWYCNQRLPRPLTRAALADFRVDHTGGGAAAVNSRAVALTGSGLEAGAPLALQSVMGAGQILCTPSHVFRCRACLLYALLTVCTALRLPAAPALYAGRCGQALYNKQNASEDRWKMNRVARRQQNWRQGWRVACRTCRHKKQSRKLLRAAGRHARCRSGCVAPREVMMACIHSFRVNLCGTTWLQWCVMAQSAECQTRAAA